MARHLILLLTLLPALIVDKPELSELEQLKVKNIVLMNELRLAYAKTEACYADIGNLKSGYWATQTDSELKALKSSLEEAHPGYRWSIDRGFESDASSSSK